MDKRELTDGPWLPFPCWCSHGCGPFYTTEQLFSHPCKTGPDGFPMHHNIIAKPVQREAPDG
jgi:hypothetical protein